MKCSLCFITGTDTGVGKTVLACLFTRWLRDEGFRAGALKPVCSGDRDDGRRLRAAAGNVLTLDETNPWHFRAPLAPLLAARLERRKLTPARAVAQIRTMARGFDILVVEGAGGLLSPLGCGMDSRDLILALRASPVVVCPNRLGAINQVLLALAALPRPFSFRAQVVLMGPRRPHQACSGNHRFLAERLGAFRVHELPWLASADAEKALAQPGVRKRMARLAQSIGITEA